MENVDLKPNNTIIKSNNGNLKPNNAIPLNALQDYDWSIIGPNLAAALAKHNEADGRCGRHH